MIHDSWTADYTPDTFEHASFGATEEFKVIAGSCAVLIAFMKCR